MNWIEYNKYEPSSYEKDAAHRLVYDMIIKKSTVLQGGLTFHFQKSVIFKTA